MNVSEFPYYRPSFSEYNVAQEKVVPFLDQDVNIVVSFATAVGKTVLAECCFGYHLQVRDECRVVYVCPYRSLAAEKHEEWKKNVQLSSGGMVLSTGDTDTNVLDYPDARLAILTSESFDSKTRSKAYKKWLRDVDCVVFDEAHMVGDKSRGGPIESSMMRFTDYNRTSRLILLSATMSNAMEVARWVKSLNGKPTKCVTSSWRPAQVEVRYVVVENNDEKLENAVELASESKSTKTVVFVHSKIVGAQLVKMLRRQKVRCAFHNASVPSATRKKMESAFNDKDSGLNVLVSTSTLAAGVNIG